MSPFIAAYAAQVARQPDGLAFEDAAGQALSHGALWARAGAQAEALRALGAGPEVVVALELPRSLALIVGVLATWRAEAAWTIIDPALPAARRATLRALAGAELQLDAHGLRRIAPPPPARPRHRHPLAYVAFTSGSSGAPKGVLIEHGGLLPMLQAQIEAFGLDRTTRALWVLQPSFDASVSDLGTALLAGGALLIDAPDLLTDPARLIETLTRRQITALDLPPSVLARLDIGRLPASLRTLILGGEVAAPAAVRAAAARHRVINVYGPTEATVCTSLERCDPTWQGQTLGAPLPGIRYRIVADELWVSGPGLARGYAQDPERTAARFVEDARGRWYRTGDRVRRDGDAWRFEGRLDRQVKLGGKRAEPEEIEAVLATLGVAAAVIPQLLAGRTVLVACYEGPAAPADLIAALSARLPAWLLPARWIPVERLPRTARGKLDLAAVAALAADTEPPPAHWPTDPHARRLAAHFAAVLGRDRVGPDDDFFALGGDSLALLTLLARAEAAGLALTASQVYAAPTPARLAAARGDPEHRPTAQLAARVPPAPSPTRRRPRGDALILTGATGFLGARLHQALRARGHAVIALVRAPSHAAACARVTGEALAADVSQPRLGLDPATYAALVARTGQVIHLAAQVSLASSLEALFPTNVAGTQHALALAAAAGAPCVYASTLSVFVASDRPPGPRYEDDPLTTPAFISGGYAQSKWIAERLVRRASGPICVLRYGLLTPDRCDHAAPPGDWLVRFVRAARDLAALDTDALGFDATPVDHAVDATLRLIEGGARGTYHLAGARPVTARRLLAALRAEGLGAPADPGDAAADPAQLLGAARASDPQRFARHRALDLFAATRMRFDDRRARAWGIRAPAVDDAYLRACVRAMRAAP